ncbi:uncharacterized protein LOC128881372 [Hylaeus volcanicus]|uniref:uncharacterized protein LOC128881372 n=1 Tax=Hylaeus volcanicus TaxID=313075 RepID=UPI0023B7C8D9|nr:uncharacterized protein LOC128881372 [Hylaeus volcanicus]
MGNTKSTQPPKPRKDRKKEQADGVDDRPRKNKRAANASNTRTSRSERVTCRCTNPFIIFFLRLRSKTPKEPVTVIARAAGKLWTKMSPEQRKKYIDLANAEKKRRQGKRKLRLRKRR